MKNIIVAGGCFWGVQEYYRRLKGIETTKVGYAQSNSQNPSYRDVCDGETEAVEAVYLEYDENVISLEKIFEHLFRIIDPTTLNKQAMDVGTQYRSGIYYAIDEERDLALAYIESVKDNYKEEVVVEVVAIDNFYDAETYHQNYLVKNANGYCHVDFSKANEDELK